MGKDQFKKQYEELEEHLLIGLALNGSKDLTPEAADALIEVLNERDFDKGIIDNVKRQRKDFSDDEISKIAKEYTKGVCPRCKNNDSINALRMTKISGAVIITHYESALIIGCRNCISKEVKKTVIHNLLAGMWTFSRFLGTPFNIISLLIRHSKLKNNFDRITDDYDEFLRNNVGYILNQINQ